MQKKTLGTQGLQVGAQGLGCMNLTGFYGKPFDKKTALAAVDKALELGVTFFDSSDAYGHHTIGFGENERFLGEALRAKRDRAVIGTKFGFLESAAGRGGDKNLSEKGVNSTTVRADPSYVQSACEASLKRLGVDHIDVYFAHRLSPDVPVEETVGAMAGLVKAGKVRHLGLCGVSAELLKRAAAIHPVAALESEWSLWTRDIEYEVLAVARSLGTGIVTYAPLGRGFLTGELRSFDDLARDDFRRTFPRFQGENFKRNLELVDHVKKVANEKGCTGPQLALAWLNAQGNDVIPIPGAERPEYVIDNVGALDVKLTAEDLAAIDAIFPLGAAAGARYANMTQVSDAVDTTKLGKAS
jgi:aryl-alcohol dehydrogenase-like predicted oxidoreductase